MTSYCPHTVSLFICHRCFNVDKIVGCLEVPRIVGGGFGDEDCS